MTTDIHAIIAAAKRWGGSAETAPDKARDTLRQHAIAMAEALAYAVENGPGVSYWNEGDSVGGFGCCGETSHKPHAKDCWFQRLRDCLDKIVKEANRD